MNKLLIATLVSAFLLIPASADGFDGEIGYSRISVSDSGLDLDFGTVYANGGYRWDHASNYSSTAEILLATGIQEGDFFGSGVSLSSAVGAGYKGTWQMSSNDVQLFWRANYTQMSLTASGIGIDDSAHDEGLGIGVGLIWNHVTLGYTTYQGDLKDFDSINIGYKF